MNFTEVEKGRFLSSIFRTLPTAILGACVCLVACMSVAPAPAGSSANVPAGESKKSAPSALVIPGTSSVDGLVSSVVSSQALGGGRLEQRRYAMPEDKTAIEYAIFISSKVSK